MPTFTKIRGLQNFLVAAFLFGAIAAYCRSNDLEKAWHSFTHPSARHATKAVKKAVKDVGTAARAAASFAVEETKVALSTPERALHQKNVGDSLWYLASHPVKKTNENAVRALASSEILSTAAAVAASAYGGPAGAAAFSAWTTYNATGGDINAAIKVGVTQGVIASATASVAKMPPGATKSAADAALKAGIAKVQGASSDEIREAALSSLVSSTGAKISAADLGTMKRTLSMAAVGGAAVAASGGNRDSIRKGFLQGGGRVLVQDLKSASESATASARKDATSFVESVIPPEKVAEANKLYTATKNDLTDSEVAKKIAAAKNAYNSSIKPPDPKELAARDERLKSALQFVDIQRASAANARVEMQKKMQALRKDTEAKISTAQTEAKSSAAARTAAQTQSYIADARRAEASELARLESSQKAAEARAAAAIESKASSIKSDMVSKLQESLEKDKDTAEEILDNGMIVSWNPSTLK